jgi:hypothetical protein
LYHGVKIIHRNKIIDWSVTSVNRINIRQEKERRRRRRSLFRIVHARGRDSYLRGLSVAHGPRTPRKHNVVVEEEEEEEFT